MCPMCFACMENSAFNSDIIVQRAKKLNIDEKALKKFHRFETQPVMHCSK